MATTDEMLRYIHKKDPKTLSKRYSPQQLQAAFQKLGGGAPKGAAGAASAAAPAAAPVAEPAPVDNSVPASVGTSVTSAPPTTLAELGATATNAAASNLRGSDLGSAFNPDLIDRTSTGDMLKDRARIEEALFGSLTRNFDRDKGREEEQIRQRLANQGIPYSADPNSRYQQELGGLNERYDTLRQNAMQNATILGGQEWERGVGINETVRGNQFGEQTGTRNQQLGEVSQLQGLDAVAQQIANQKKQLQIQREAQARRGGGAPVAAQEPSPFNYSAPPGL